MSSTLPFADESAVAVGAWQLLTTLLQQPVATDPLGCTVPVSTVFPGDQLPDVEQLALFFDALRGCGIRQVKTDENGTRISTAFSPLFILLGYEEQEGMISAQFNPSLLLELHQFRQQVHTLPVSEQYTQSALQTLLPTFTSRTLRP